MAVMTYVMMQLPCVRFACCNPIFASSQTRETKNASAAYVCVLLPFRPAACRMFWGFASGQTLSTFSADMFHQYVVLAVAARIYHNTCHDHDVHDKAFEIASMLSRQDSFVLQASS